MIRKIVAEATEALGKVKSGSTVLVGGFGEAGNPTELVHALIETGARDLVVVNNNAGNGMIGLAKLIAERRVAKLICSYPRSSHNDAFRDLHGEGGIELEVVPQGTLAERIRAGGAGIPAFYTPTAAGTLIAAGKETRNFDGKVSVLEHAIVADLALIKAEVGDRWGNLSYRMAARNFGPVMATAAKRTVAQVRRTVELGEIDPETVVTPGIFVDAVVQISEPVSEADHLRTLEQAS